MEAELGAMCLQAKEPRGLLANHQQLEKARKDLPGGLRGSLALLIPGLQIPGCQN